MLPPWFDGTSCAQDYVYLLKLTSLGVLDLYLMARMHDGLAVLINV